MKVYLNTLSSDSEQREEIADVSKSEQAIRYDSRITSRMFARWRIARFRLSAVALPALRRDAISSHSAPRIWGL